MCAPTYTTSVLGYLEEILYQEVEQIFDLYFKLYFEQNWKRFNDDCLIIFTKEESELNLLHATVNNLYLSFKFTIEYDKTSLPFLDLMVINKGGKIETDLFYKNTDSKQYLLFNSCHPKNTRNNIPYNLARRIKTIGSDDEQMIKRM